jgi:hypothetical protein
VLRIPGIGSALLAAAALLGTAAVAGAQAPCGGLLQPRCASPPPVAPPPAVAPPVPVTIKLTPASVTRRVAEFTKPIAFHGQVSGLADPHGLPVELEITVPGYGTAADTRHIRGTVDSSGGFDISIPQNMTARVRAVLSATTAVGHSAVSKVTVHSLLSLDLRAVSPTRGRFRLSSQAPSYVVLRHSMVRPRPGSAGRGYLYVVSRGGASARLVARGRAGARSCRGLCERSTTGTFRLTAALQRATHFFACTRTPLFRGVVDDGASRLCGRRTLRLR